MSQPPHEHEPPTGIKLMLVAEDDRSAQRISQMLGHREGNRFEITHVRQVDDALLDIQSGGVDVMLLDLSYDEGYGLEPLLRARVAAQAVPIVVLTYQRDEELAVKAVRVGAQDYLAKGEVSPELLSRTLLHAVERHRMMRELTEAQQRQHFLATHDALTKLPNRYAFLASLRHVLEDARRNASEAAVLFFDLDGFKSINDNLGHSAGDELLTDVARRVRGLIRKSDLVARLGGDEFVAAIRNIPSTQAPLRVADQIREVIQKPFYVMGMECWVSTSVGISIFPQDGSEADDLIRAADTAMYQAKSSGKNQVRLYDSTMNEEATERFELVNGLREAIRSGQLVLMFQPQVNVISGELVGAETLVRWRHPVRGLVSPSEFISVAEDTGLIVALGEWVLRTACEVAAGWGAMPDGRIAVNVSERQLESRGFTARVQQILEDTGLPARRLEIELTESLAASQGALRALEELRVLGIRTAIDDFGTGYSSLTLLKHAPVDTLKIDGSFASDAVGEGPDAAILEAILRMASGLGLEVVAEGVESLEEMEALRAMGCAVMQGYLFSKPIARQDYEASVLAEDAAWRIPLERPEDWVPEPETPLPEAEDDPNEDLPALRD